MRKAMYVLLLSLYLAQGVLTAEGECHVSKKMLDGSEQITIENDYVLMTFLPYRGGVCSRFLYKPTKSEWTMSKPGAGMFLDLAWQQKRFKKGDFINAPYTPKFLENTPNKIVLQLRGKGHSGDFQFTFFRKTITLERNSAAVRVDYAFEVMHDAMSPKTVGLWFHNSIAIPGEVITYFTPTAKGVSDTIYDPSTPPDEIWQYEPRRGWIGAVARNGAGFAVKMDYAHLMCFYQWFGSNLSTLEWMFRNVTIPNGKEFKTSMIFQPFQGLKRVDGVGNGLVAAIAAPKTATAGKQVRVGAGIWMAEPVKDLRVAWQYRKLPSDIWTDLSKADTISSKRPGIKKVSADFTPEANGVYGIRMVVSKGGETMLVAEKSIRVGSPKLAYDMKPLTKRLGDPKDRFGRLSYNPKSVTLPLTMKVVTPHIAWAKPYYKGKLKVLILQHNYNAREIVELAERMDIDYDAPLIDYGSPVYIGDVYGKLNLTVVNDILKKALSKTTYDVILISDPTWSTLSKELPPLLAKQVANGVGLVYIAPKRFSKLPNPEVWDFMPVNQKRYLRSRGAFSWRETKDNPVTEGVPLSVLPTISRIVGYAPASLSDTIIDGIAVNGKKKLPLATMTEKNNQRTVMLSYRASRVGSGYGGTLTPFIRFPKERFQYWEYFHSLLAKALLWAGKRESGVRLKLSKSGKTMNVAFFGKDLAALGECSLEWILRDEFGAEREKGVEKTNPSKSLKPVVVKLPANLESGMYLVDTILRCQGKSVSWASVPFYVKLPSRIVNFELPGGDNVPFGTHFHKTGETVKAEASVIVAAPNTRIVADLVDKHGRKVDSKTISVAKCATGKPRKVEVAFILNHPLTTVSYIKIRLENDKRCFDKAMVDFVSIPDEFVAGVWDDFELIPWGSMGGYDQGYLIPEKAKLCKAGGISVMFLNSSWHRNGPMGDLRLEHESSIRAGFRGIEVNLWHSYPNHYLEDRKNYQKTKDKKYLQRDPSLGDTAYLAKMIKKVREKAELYKKIYPLAWMWGDEQSVIGRISAFDYDFSPAGLRGFRQWLADKYGTLDSLNSEWRRSYRSWEQVTPLTLGEAKAEKNYAPWSDLRTYMEYSYAHFFEMLSRTLREVSPNAFHGPSGTQAPTAYNGCDWTMFSNIFTYMQPYYYNGLEELIPSLSSPSMPRAAWIGYGSTKQSKLVWNRFFLGDRSFSYFSLRSFLNPDFTYSKSAESVIKAVAPMRTGLAKLWSSVEIDNDQIAILYGQRSLHGAYIMDQPYTLQMRGWFAAMGDVGYSPKLITTRQIDSGILSPKRFKALVLPLTCSITRTQAIEIKEYVRKGGVVLADYDCGLFDGHCQPVKIGMLDELFGIKHTASSKPLPSGIIKFRAGKSLNLAGLEVGTTVKETGMKLDGGEALATLAGEPIAIVNTFGKGKTCYLNLSMDKYFSTREKASGTFYRNIAARLLTWSGLKPKYKIVSPKFRARIYRYKNGGNIYLGYMRSEDHKTEWTLNLSEPGNVYNVLTGEYLGRVNLIKSGSSPQAADFFAILPYKVVGLSAKFDKAEYKLGDTASIALGIKTDGVKPSAHAAHVEVLNPKGEKVEYYGGNVLLKNGKGRFEIPFALNDQTGLWTVKARDAVTGAKTAINIKLEK